MSTLLTKFGTALMCHFHAFGVQPVSTILVCALVLDIIIVTTCVIKLIIIYSRERKTKKVKARFGNRYTY